MTQIVSEVQALPDHHAQQPVVRVRDLRVAFPHVDVQAVDGVSFDLHAGRCVALVGESGSGKSVTSRSLIGLAGRGAQVSASELSLLEQNLLTFEEGDFHDVRGYSIGYILQDALVSLDPFRRIGHEVGDSIRVHGTLNRRERRARVLQLLSDVGIPQPELRYRQYSHQLSGGLRQRALIASAIAAGPRVLIADEPTTALDVTVQAQILQLLGSLKEQGTALLLVSHDLAVVSSIADEIIVLNDGEVVEQGEPWKILTEPEHPYTRQLLDAVPAEHNRGVRLSGGEPAHFEAIGRENSFHSTNTEVISVSNLNKGFRTGTTLIRAVDDVSFTVTRGRTLGIVGESGSGKSTLANIILGFTEPDSGTVSIADRPWSGEHTTEADRRAHRPLIQSINQDPLGSFDPRHDVETIISEALAVAGVERGRRPARTLALLEQVGLNETHIRRHPLQLSGGQRQRVAIARALATGPSILICDEPVSALDVSVQAQVLDLLRDLQQQTTVTLVFISHDLAVVNHIADDLIVLKDGVIVEQGTVNEIFRQPQHPYTRELLAAVPRITTTHHSHHEGNPDEH